MAEITGISWCRSTFSPWIGCTEVSTEETGGGGCDHCYARELDARYRWGGATHWGAGVPRHRTSAAYWRQAENWNRHAGKERVAGLLWNGRPGFWPVFPSLCDPFDNEVTEEWHADFWRLIRATPNLTWLLLTKRIGNVEKMAPPGEHPNVWIGASIVNQREADRDVPKLNALRGFAKLFISYEPALGPVDWERAIPCGYYCDPEVATAEDPLFGHHDHGPNGRLGHIDQIIVGGESNQGKHKARPFVIEWARDTLRQCRSNGVACFVKQLGSFVEGDANDPRNPPLDGDTPLICYSDTAIAHFRLKDRAGADPAEWPEDLRVQEFPV